ncbi:MAG: hypothetical protein AAFR28_18880, partial [Pseudomonadota bacterium]
LVYRLGKRHHDRPSGPMPFQWARCVCPEPLFEAPDALNAWIEKLLDAHSGCGRNAKRAA